MRLHARKPVAPPSAEDRERARVAAAALRAALADPSTTGNVARAHIDFARPRRAEWWTTWSNLPGFARISGQDGLRFTHLLLPGWEYAPSEIVTEMIPDLEALAERGERPTEATR